MDLQNMAASLGALNQSNGFPLPIFIRYFWEFNVNASTNPNANMNGGCFTGSTLAEDATQFKNAWKQIYLAFQVPYRPYQYVSFVWNPNVQDNANDDAGIADADAFYPGPQYVDWIGLDGYNKQTCSGTPQVCTPLGFTGVFSTSLGEYSTYGKPIMIGETGSCAEYPAPPDGQDAYLSSLYSNLNDAQTVPSVYSNVKVVNYFDAPGTYVDKATHNPCDDDLVDGLNEFATLAQNPLFNPGTH